MTPSPAALPTLDEIRDELAECDSTNDRLSYLIELGDCLEDFPQEQCIEANRVLGCQSMVWLTHQLQGDVLRFQATSDAPMVRGLVAILLAAYSGKSPQDILAFPVQEFFASIELSSFVSPMRSNGLNSMVQRVQQLAKVASNVHLAEAEKVSVRREPTRAIEGVRADFPILARRLAGDLSLIYFDNAASTQRPQVVLDCMQEVYSRYYSNAHRSGHALAYETTMAMEEAREAVRQFIHAADRSEIVFTSGTTAAINLVAQSWGSQHLKAGDEILLTEMEHHSNIVPWQQLAAQTGAVIRWLPIQEDFQLDLGALETLLTERTRLVAVTAVSNMLGTINPIRRIADAVHAMGGVIMVDAAQAVSVADVDVQAMDADFCAFGGHKMLGPNGVGVLYGRSAILESMPPWLGGGGMIDTVTKTGFTPATVPHRFEAGTPAIAEIIGMKPAINYLLALGTTAMLQHERRLLEAAEASLRPIPGLRIWGPAISERVGILTLTHDRIDVDQMGRRLDAAGIAVRVGHHCAMPLHQRLGLAASCRISFHVYNTLEEVETMVDVIAKLTR